MHAQTHAQLRSRHEQTHIRPSLCPWRLQFNLKDKGGAALGPAAKGHGAAAVDVAGPTHVVFPSLLQAVLRKQCTHPASGLKGIASSPH